MQNSKAIIEIKHLVKRYPRTKSPALKGIDLSIHKGEFFGLIGPNGSGKTTLISILCGLLSASNGDAFIAGFDIYSQMNLILPMIGLVPQEIALYPTLTLRQNFEFFAKLYGLPKKLVTERIDKYLEVSRLTEQADSLVQGFSGGMKRRANLAAGMLHEPQIIFFDEPTVGVDTVSRHMIFETIRALNDLDKTIIYTTHYLEEAQKLCSRIGIINQGEILTQGSPEQLIAASPDCENLGDVFVHLVGNDLRSEL